MLLPGPGPGSPGAAPPAECLARSPAHAPASGGPARRGSSARREPRREGHQQRDGLEEPLRTAAIELAHDLHDRQDGPRGAGAALRQLGESLGEPVGEPLAGPHHDAPLLSRASHLSISSRSRLSAASTSRCSSSEACSLSSIERNRAARSRSPNEIHFRTRLAIVTSMDSSVTAHPMAGSVISSNSASASATRPVGGGGLIARSKSRSAVERSGAASRRITIIALNIGLPASRSWIMSATKASRSAGGLGV